MKSLKKNPDQKKINQKLEIALKFTWKILHKLIGPRKKIIREFPLNLIWVHFTGKSLVFFLTFSTISKKSNLEGVFEFFDSDPQLVQIFKPTGNLPRLFLYIWVKSKPLTQKQGNCVAYMSKKMLFKFKIV